MTNEIALPRWQAIEAGDELCNYVHEQVERIALVGAVRRREPWIYQLDLLATPRATERRQASLLGDPDQLMADCRLHRRLTELATTDYVVPIRPKSRSDKPDPAWKRKGQGADKAYHVLLTPYRLRASIHLVRPEQWGLGLIAWTGDEAFKRLVFRQWNRVSGGRVHDYRLHRKLSGAGPHHTDRKGVPLGPPVATQSERAVFDAIRMRPVPPAQRSRVAREALRNAS